MFRSYSSPNWKPRTIRVSCAP